MGIILTASCTHSGKDAPAPTANGESADAAAPMAVDAAGGGPEPAAAPQNDAGGWQAVQDGAAPPVDVPSSVSRFAPGTKFVVNTA